MGHLIIHDMDTAWTSSNPGVLAVSVDTHTLVEGAASNRLVATPGALGAYAEIVLGKALDLSGFEELRFWVLGTRRAEGSAASPFYLELSYIDSDDAPGEEHRWFISINRPGVWEQRRIGIQGDRRKKIVRFRLRALTNLSFTCYVDELLAVHEDMLADAEAALVERLSGLTLPGSTGVPLQLVANPGDAVVVLPLSTGFNDDNRISIQGGGAGDEQHTVVTATHDVGAGTTTLSFAPGDLVVGLLPAGVATVTLVVPVLPQTPPIPLPSLTPAIIVTLLDTREDPSRSSDYTQRDSFRPRGTRTACSSRPSAQAFQVSYEITALAPSRAQYLTIHNLILRRTAGFGQTRSTDALRINGYPSPLMKLPPPELLDRHLGTFASLYVRIGTRMEVAERVEAGWVQQPILGAGILTNPLASGNEGLFAAPIEGGEPPLPPDVDPLEEEGIVIEV